MDLNPVFYAKIRLMLQYLCFNNTDTNKKCIGHGMENEAI